MHFYNVLAKGMFKAMTFGEASFQHGIYHTALKNVKLV